MMQRALALSRNYRRRGAAYAQRAVGGFALMVMHELDALSGHAAEVRERLAVAREARSLRQLVLDQVDLLAETRARLHLDQRERRALLHSWVADLRHGLRAAA
jgi:hypothetical protein